MRLIHIDEQTERAYLKKCFENKTITTNQLIHLIFKYGWLRHSLLICLGNKANYSYTYKIDILKSHSGPRHNGLRLHHSDEKQTLLYLRKPFVFLKIKHFLNTYSKFTWYVAQI